jgi:hypothetical protein
MPIKVIARVMGCSKNTVKAALRSSGPPEYQRRGPGSIVDEVTAATRNCPETATKLPGSGRESCPLTVMRSARHEFVCLAASRG